MFARFRQMLLKPPEGPFQGHPGHFETSGQFRLRRAFLVVGCVRDGDGIGAERVGPPEVLAALPGSFHTGDGVLYDHVALKLCKGAEEVIDELAAGRRRVHPLTQRAEMDPFVAEAHQEIGQVQHRAAQPVELENHHGVARLQHREHVIEAGAARLRP